MVNRINRNTARKINKSTRSDASASVGYPAKSWNSRNTNFNEAPIIDEVIAHLANAHENRRARQVTEWERMLGQNIH